MKSLKCTWCIVVLLAVVSLPAAWAFAQDVIAESEITDLRSQLSEAGEGSSSARKKLAVRRVIRAAEGLVEDHPEAPNRFAVLGLLFEAQQDLLALDDSSANRQALLDIASQLAEAPDDYAQVRLDADLLLSQAALARSGGDLRERADALRELVDRYRGTEAEKKVVRITMLMALELGDAGLSDDMVQVIAEQFPEDREMLIFLRERLAGQVLGAPVVGTLESSTGQTYRFPMDFIGKTVAVFFWTNEDNTGEEHIEQLAAVWKEKQKDAEGRMVFVSVNLDDLPDAGESLLRKHGLDWLALKLPAGEENEFFKAYGRPANTVVTISSAGYAAMFKTGGNSHSSGYERRVGSMLARSWTKPLYTAELRSVFNFEFLVQDPTGEFDPAAPPEWKAVRDPRASDEIELVRNDTSIPEDLLREIQACFVLPPTRYSVPPAQMRANFEKAESLCAKTIADHGDAPDLWVVRNRRIVALTGLWRLNSDTTYLARAADEARAMLEESYPGGTDVIARLCLAREALHSVAADPDTIVRELAQADEAAKASAPALAAAALLALEVGNRRLHEEYRRQLLDQHANDPAFWTLTAFLLDRHHRYWMYHPPFTAGWTYGRRQSHFFSIGDPEDAERQVQFELKTLDGETVTFPQHADGKWSIIQFAPNAAATTNLNRYIGFAKDRPFDDVRVFAAVMSNDVEEIKAEMAAKRTPDTFPTFLVPGGADNPLVRQLGLLDVENGSNTLILRPDGSIAVMQSALVGTKGNMMQSVLEWHDKKTVENALARGDLDEAKRLAFAYAPLKQEPPADAPKNWKPKPISTPHRWARALVYAAIEDWSAAAADAEAVYIDAKRTAGYLSMRTEEYAEIERFKALIDSKLQETKAAD